jgi:hypothetical protein
MEGESCLNRGVCSEARLRLPQKDGLTFATGAMKLSTKPNGIKVAIEGWRKSLPPINVFSPVGALGSTTVPTSTR